MANREAGPVTVREAGYDLKDESYFAMARRDYVAELPHAPDAAILEIGCSNGATGALALAEGKCGRYCGVELFDGPAAVARERLTEVVVGDVEELELPWPPGTFDALILSEVLEHLRDPWAVLRRVRPLLRPGAVVFASTPNVAHREIIVMLLRGRWELRSYGPMDATHLRWFTPSEPPRGVRGRRLRGRRGSAARRARAGQRRRRQAAARPRATSLAPPDRPARPCPGGGRIAGPPAADADRRSTRPGARPPPHPRGGWPRRSRRPRSRSRLRDQHGARARHGRSCSCGTSASTTSGVTRR